MDFGRQQNDSKDWVDVRSLRSASGTFGDLAKTVLRFVLTVQRPYHL